MVATCKYKSFISILFFFQTEENYPNGFLIWTLGLIHKPRGQIFGYFWPPSWSLFYGFCNKMANPGLSPQMSTWFMDVPLATSDLVGVGGGVVGTENHHHWFQFFSLPPLDIGLGGKKYGRCQCTPLHFLSVLNNAEFFLHTHHHHCSLGLMLVALYQKTVVTQMLLLKGTSPHSTENGSS